jgi:peptide/nickel transport system ATP-binding protein
MVFQDPFASLNPIKRIEHNLIRPLRLVGHGAGAALDRKVEELLESVGLPGSVEFRKRFPHELSGGQRQRVSIARALASNPRILLADEPTSMLDVSIRANVQALLGSLQQDRGIALLYVTHDLRSARLVAPELAVMHSGRVVEQGPTGELLSRPAHPYTRSLLAALPGSHVAPLPIASPAAWRAQTGGCPLVKSCPNALEKCGRIVPSLEPGADSAGSPRRLRCHAPLSRQY